MRFARRCWIFSENIVGLSDGQFRRMYRMSKVEFQQLVTVNREHRQRAERRTGRHAVDAKLSITLRWLASGSYLYIALDHCVSVSTFSHVVDETICDIGDTITMVFRHENEEYLERVSTGFTRGRSLIYGCAGAIDRIAIKIVEPWARTTANSSTCFNRKGFFALNVQAMCDCDYKFTFVSVNARGSASSWNEIGQRAPTRSSETPHTGSARILWRSRLRENLERRAGVKLRRQGFGNVEPAWGDGQQTLVCSGAARMTKRGDMGGCRISFYCCHV
jgi:hypothetical protein